jgi:hypothetical protein
MDEAIVGSWENLCPCELGGQSTMCTMSTMKMITMCIRR